MFDILCVGKSKPKSKGLIYSICITVLFFCMFGYLFCLGGVDNEQPLQSPPSAGLIFDQNRLISFYICALGPVVAIDVEKSKVCTIPFCFI